MAYGHYSKEEFDELNHQAEKRIQEDKVAIRALHVTDRARADQLHAMIEEVLQEERRS